MGEGRHDSAIRELGARLGSGRLLTGLTERLARAHDASIYRLVPTAIARPHDIADVQTILEICRAHGLGVTFRAAGTSLSGQAVTDGLLVELGAHWRRACVSADGSFVTSQPGVTGGQLNQLLSRFGRRIGPDPASIASAMIGGIVANNASGMCCGTRDNAYQTLAGMHLVLADGYAIDTATPDAPARFERERPELARKLLELRRRVMSSPRMVETIRRKYAIKNTMGYSVNALLDHERPLDILSHLLVGSEGTLGFIAEVTLRTVGEPPHKATALAFFTELVDAGAAVEPLAALGAAVLELMDHSSMQALAAEMSYPFALPPRCAALLIELQEPDHAMLEEKIAACRRLLPNGRLLAPLDFTEDSARRAHYWKLRKGLFPKVGGERPLGTAVIIEDICLPRARLAEGVAALHGLLESHGFHDAVIFGHAKDGNLHFVLCNDFSRAEAVERYAAMMEALAELVVGYGGSLKAEHGTGRNMAPFVRKEWGNEIYDVMREVKRLLDPLAILGQGVLLTDDEHAHLRHLKALPPVAERIDRCIECGFCEKVCPSRDLSLTPRQRIAIRREAVLLERAGERRALRALRDEYEYAGVETCAGDGLCATVCPVGIDTGAYIRELRAEKRGRFANAVALFLAGRIAWLAALARWGLTLLEIARRAGLRLPDSLAHVKAARITPRRKVSRAQDAPRVVHFAACLTRIMDDGDAVRRTLELCGYDVVAATPATACCGQPFASKGFEPAARAAAQGLLDHLWRASEEGRLPIVCDTSPCTARLLSFGSEPRWRELRILDFPTFMAREVIPRRKEWPKVSRHLILHPTCSSMRHETVGDLVKVARAFASEVTLPLNVGCCGFAGDKGFQLPELTASATRDESAEVKRIAGESRSEVVGISTCQTCALGMTTATGIGYESVASLCLEALRGVE